MSHVTQHHPMPTADAAWLHMDRPTNLTIVNLVWCFDAPVDWERVKEVCRERLVGRFPRFSQRVADPRVPLRSVAWENDPRFDLEHHFHHLALPAPGDKAALHELVADLMATPLDHDKPLWDMYLVEGYGPGCAIVFRVHHCIADGIALMGVMVALSDDAPDGAVAPTPLTHRHRRRAAVMRASTASIAAWASRVRRAAVALAHAILHVATDPRQLRHRLQAATDAARALTKVLLAGSDAETALRGELGVAQRAASTRPMCLADITRTGHATGTTVNDVVLSALTGALSSYLLERDGTVSEIRAVVPINLRPLSEPVPRELGNKFGLTLLTLPLGFHDPRRRLAEVHRRMCELKQSPEGAVSYGVLSVLGTMPPGIERVVIDLYSAKASAVVTDVPGPPHAVYLGGAPVLGMLGWAPRAGSMSMSVTILSYNREITVSLAVDAGLIPDPERIVAGVEDELAELQGLASGVGGRVAAPNGDPVR